MKHLLPEPPDDDERWLMEPVILPGFERALAWAFAVNDGNFRLSSLVLRLPEGQPLVSRRLRRLARELGCRCL